MANKDTLQFVESLVNFVLYKFDCVKIPVDLDKLAAGLGVCSIRYEPMRAWGCVEQSVDGFVIRVREDAPLTRQRFTIAHELGHLLLDIAMKKEASLAYKRFRSFASVSDELANEESLADELAGQLLLPSWYLKSKIGDNLSISGLAKAAHEAQTSLSAALLRATRIATEPCVAFHVRSSENSPQRVMWSRHSDSLSKDIVGSDLSLPDVVAELLAEGRVLRTDLQLLWLDCQKVTKKYEGITNTYCFARVRQNQFLF